MSNFLPGPYYAYDHTSMHEGNVIGAFQLLDKPTYAEAPIVIANVWCYGGDYFLDKDTARATANLLAAAPDMYEAMKGFLQTVGTDKALEYCEAMKAAIAKAEGITEPENQTA